MQVIIDRSIRGMSPEEIRKEIRRIMGVCHIILIDPRTNMPWIIERLNETNLGKVLKKMRELRDENFKGEFELVLENEQRLGNPNNHGYLKTREYYY